MSKSLSVLLRNVKIFDKQSNHHLQTTDVFIQDGVVQQIGKNLSIDAEEVIDRAGLCISPGWFDIGAQCGEPGREHQETLKSLSAAAQKGGYTCVAIFPNTKPSLDHKSLIDYIINQSEHLSTHILPIGALSKNCAGKELAEMLDMHNSGAIAFSDGSRSVNHAGLLSKSLQYALTTGRPVINHPASADMLHDTYVHEGPVSTSIGIKGEPALAEQLMLNRDIQLAQYAEAPLISHLISTAESLDLVQRAKRNGIKIKATVSAMHLTETDNKVLEFDPSYKQSPPLRGESDRLHLVKGCQDLSIDAIVTNHTPLDTESKDLEFAYAQPGAIGLETCFALLNSKELNTEIIVDYLSHRNRDCIGLDTPHIIEGGRAEITLFDPEEQWTFTEKNIGSISKNTPYLNSDFVGRVFGTIQGGKLFKNL